MEAARLPQHFPELAGSCCVLRRYKNQGQDFLNYLQILNLKFLFNIKIAASEIQVPVVALPPNLSQS